MMRSILLFFLLPGGRAASLQVSARDGSVVALCLRSPLFCPLSSPADPATLPRLLQTAPVSRLCAD